MEQGLRLKMGMNIFQLKTEFRVRKERHAPMLEALKKAILETPEEFRSGGERRGDRIVRFLAFTNQEKALIAEDIEGALYHCRWSPSFDESGNIRDLEFIGEKLGDDEIIFAAIAPYIEAGSFIEMVNDRREIWRWRFDGDRCHKEFGELTFRSGFHER